MARLEIREQKVHQFKGKVPEVPTYDHVDTDMLYQGDNDPFHITLGIMEVDEISENGVIYDEQFVTEIENQLAGSGGIRGHKGFFNADDYPVEAVDWIGHIREGGITYAKGYIPPGETREQIRRLKARGGLLGTSFYGYIQNPDLDVEFEEPEDKSENDNGATPFHLHNLTLVSYDLVHPKEASLKTGQKTGFVITRETIQKLKASNNGDKSMGDNKITIDAVPEDVRKQIIEQASIEADAKRVKELQSQIKDLDGQLKELRNEVSGHQTTIETLTAERDAAKTLVAEYRQQQFDTQLNAQVAELFQGWSLSNPDVRQRVEGLQRAIRGRVLMELKEDNQNTVEDIVQAVWDQEFQYVAEGLKLKLMGPFAIIGEKVDGDDKLRGLVDSEEGRKALKRKFGFGGLVS